MSSLGTPSLPPNPPPSPNEPPPNPRERRTPSGRYVGLEEHDLLHLVDALDDETSRARFRESVYISVIVCMAIAWFLAYGPTVLFHEPRLISPTDVLRQREIATLTTPSDLARQAARQAQKPPTVSQQTMKELQAMRRAEDANRAARRAAAPKAEPAPQEAQPQAPTPQPAAPPPPEVAVEKPALPTPVAPKPAPAQPLAESPRPQPTRPNFATTQNAGDAIQRAARDAMQNHSGSGSGTMQGPARGGPAQLGNGYEVLSDTQGVNFDPYLKRILTMIRNNWIPLLPEETQPPISKQGITQIRFIILPNGQIGGIFPEASTRDEALDRAAWGSITGVGQFPPLPAEFHGPNLELRLRYFVNRPPQ